jgi:hypothetical protein
LASLTPEQRRRRERIEGLIRLAEPALNLVLVAGERLSRIVERDDHDYYPPQRGHLPPGAESGEKQNPTAPGSGREVATDTQPR